MLKSAVAILGMALFGSLVGCMSSNTTQLNTQAQGQVALEANQYAIQIGFSAQGKSTEAALAKLNDELSEFMQWKEESGFKVVTQNESIQPLYHYPQNGPRQLTGYQALHSFQVKGLDLDQYADAIKALAAYQPESLYQGEVGVSDDMRQQALAQAYAIAYQANQAKLSTLMGLAELCSPRVESIKEYTQSYGAPRGMMMEAKSSAPVANEHTVSVRLDMTWQASDC